MTRPIGAGGDHHRGHPRNGNAGLNWGSRQSLPDKTSRPSCQLAIKYAVTADMADGQALPPFIEDNVVWHVVRRADGPTLWRRISLTNQLTLRSVLRGPTRGVHCVAQRMKHQTQGTMQMDISKYRGPRYVKLADVEKDPAAIRAVPA